MKKMQFFCVVLFAASAVAKGILPCMVERHGLTDGQIDDLLAVHPRAVLRITAQDWRGMRYQLHRFANMTNYVQQIGSTQDCARVLLALHDGLAAASAETNRLAKVSRMLEDQVAAAKDRAIEYADAYAAATNRLAASMADYMSASNRAARAEAHTAAVVSWAEKMRDAAVLPTTKALWQSFIDKLTQEE